MSNWFPKISHTLTLLAMLMASNSSFALDLPKKQFNALLFTKTTGWHHKSIPAGVEAIQKLGDDHFFNVVWHEESRYFNKEYLKNFDVIIFLSTTGDILTGDQKAAMQDFIQSGKGFVGIHSASDTEYEWQWYTQLVGRIFVIHPPVQTAQLTVTDQRFPGLAQLPKEVLWTDEWYDFGPELSENLKYLMTVDETSYNTKSDWGDKKGDGMGDFHPIAWYQHYDGGRSFYTGLGHTKAVYKDPFMLTHLFGGIYWAATGNGLK